MVILFRKLISIAVTRRAADEIAARFDVDNAMSRKCGKDPEKMDLRTRDSVYIWKKARKDDGGPRYYHWAGPGVVIGKEGRSSVWVSFNGHLHKAAPEHVRPTTDEENIAITMVDDILKSIQQQLGSAREVSFEDLVEQIEEIPQNT